jgi:hypothetical protein
VYAAAGDKSTPEEVSWFVDLGNGAIWCASQDQIWEFDGHNWSTSDKV